jgi:hypothetical protein
MVSSNKSWMQSFIPFALEELHFHCYDVTLWREFSSIYPISVYAQNGHVLTTLGAFPGIFCAH